MEDFTPPGEGWSTLPTTRYSSTIGPSWARGRSPDSEVGFHVSRDQTNEHLGTVHGGALMTFADVALGYAVVEALGAPHCATVSLQLQFVSTAPVGAFITCRPEIVRRTRSLMFLRGLMVAGDAVIASADGIWKIFDAAPS